MAVKCNQLVYTPVNALTFRITGSTELLVPKKSENIITSLKGGPNDIEFTLGLTTQIKGIKYKVNIILSSIK